MDMLDSLPPFIRLLFSMALVIALMGGLAYLLKYMGFAGPKTPQNKQKRLKVVESTPLDARRRLVLVQRDDKQHLVILGANSETVIETNIAAPPVTSNNAENKNNDAV